MGEVLRIRLDSSVSQGCGILTVSGDCDLDTVSALEGAITHLMAAGHHRIVADLSAATYMDSSGINAILRAGQATSDAGGWLRLVCVQGQVRRVFELVGLDQVIPFHTDVHHALDA